MYKLDEIKLIAENIDGYLSPGEGELLFNLAKSCTGKGVIVEIGSYKGKSTIFLAAGSKNGKGSKVYAIDPFKHPKLPNNPNTLNDFKKNIEAADVGDIITEIVCTSEDAVKGFYDLIEFIFIDGDHEYDAVKLDYELWYPKILDGGIMAFHDTIGDAGPRRFVNEFIFRSSFFKKATFVGSITIAQKVNKNSFKDKISNRYMLLLKNLCELVSTIYLPEFIKKTGKYMLNKMQYRD